MAAWRFHGEDLQVQQWSLVDPQAGVTTEQSLNTLQPGTTYTLNGIASDNSFETEAVDFTVADTDELRPGSVRYLVPGAGSSSSGLGVYETGTLGTFKQHGCDIEQ